MGAIEDLKADQVVTNYYNRVILERCTQLSLAFSRNYKGRYFRRKICWLLRHKWFDITDKSVKSARRCSRCYAQIIERKPPGVIRFRRYKQITGEQNEE